MTIELIEDMREVVLPFVAKKLLEINYENLGASDADEFSKNFNEILDLAIKALKAQPCDDAVKREAVLNTLDTMDKVLDEDRTVERYKELLKECYKELPPVTPKPRAGRWVKDDPWTKPHCSECGKSCIGAHGFDYITTDFCPNCGAKMEGEKHERFINTSRSTDC